MNKLGLLFKVQQRFHFFRISKCFSNKPEKPAKFPRVISPLNSKPYTIDVLQPRHREDLIKYIDEIFLPLEPMGYALGLKELREKRDPLYLSHSRKCAEIYADASLHSELNISVVALDHDGRIAGLSFGEVRRLPLGAKLVLEHSGTDDINYTSPFFKDITRMINKLDDELDLPSYLTPQRLEIARKRTPPQTVIADVFFIGTRPDVRKSGLGTALFQANFEQITSQEDIDIILAHSVNPYTSKESLKYGFKLGRKVEWPFGGLVPGRTVTWQSIIYAK